MTKAAVYTRTGDLGITGLVGGTRIRKSDPRIHLYGEVDELNSSIGMGIAMLDKTWNVDYLHEIQSSLFDLGSNLACEKENRSKYNLPQIQEIFITKLEQQIDQYDKELAPLKTFILPGGSQEAAAFHVCRTVCRRVERQLVDFEEQHPGEVPELALRFMNRLSDYFFVLSRYINFKKNIKEINWIPKKS